MPYRDWETKDAIIESTIKNVTNLEVQIALGIAKTKETSRNIEAISEQLEALKKDVITRRIDNRPREKPKNPKRILS